jgi:hypothetical protein
LKRVRKTLGPLAPQFVVVKLANSANRGNYKNSDYE